MTSHKLLPFSGPFFLCQDSAYTGIDPQRPFLPPSDSKSLGVQSTSSIVLPSRVSPALWSKAGPGPTGHSNRRQPQEGLPECAGTSSVELSVAALWWPSAVTAACPFLSWGKGHLAG